MLLSLTASTMGDATPLLNGHAVHTVDVAAQINATSNPSVLIVGAGCVWRRAR